MQTLNTLTRQDKGWGLHYKQQYNIHVQGLPAILVSDEEPTQKATGVQTIQTWPIMRSWYKTMLAVVNDTV